MDEKRVKLYQRLIEIDNETNEHNNAVLLLWQERGFVLGQIRQGDPAALRED